MPTYFTTEEELRRNVPAFTVEAITPSDDTILTDVRALYIGGTGNVAVIAEGDTDAVTFINVLGGTILPVRVKKVMATNTNATSIVALK